MDPLHPEFTRLRQIYELTDPEYKGESSHASCVLCAL